MKIDERRPLKRLTVCIENEKREDVVIIFTEPSLQELKKLVGEELIFTLVNDLLWINKEEDIQQERDENGEVVEKGEGCFELDEKINVGCKKEGIEENVDGKEGIIEGINTGGKQEEIEEKSYWKKEIVEKIEECIGEEKEINGGEKKEDMERKEEVLMGKEVGWGLKGKEARRKGEELWLEMWGKEMERREMEREKERKNMENLKSQFKMENFGDLLVQSMDIDQDTNNEFDLDYSIKEEVKNHDDKKMFPCDICGNFLSTMKSLRRHRKIHTRGTEKPEIKNDFNDSDNVEHFMDRKTDTTTIKQESQNSTVDKTKETHKKEVQTEFPCEFCGKIFKRRKILNEHRKIHTGKIPRECKICGKHSYGASSYMYHLRTHTGERPHVCDICGNAYITSTQLTCHKRIHSSERPFSCDVCKKDFRSLNDMKRHKITHTGAKPYSCDECGKLFTASQTLKEHKRSHSAEKLSYPCLVCGKEFTMIRNLRRHNKIHLGEKRKK